MSRIIFNNILALLLSPHLSAFSTGRGRGLEPAPEVFNRGVRGLFIYKEIIKITRHGDTEETIRRNGEI
ncbi:MAG TPA: hypothetical protein DCY98_07695 [Nitrospinae bacterium]|nr:hypothetical protein [Nitrospinota bacterium]